MALWIFYVAHTNLLPIQLFLGIQLVLILANVYFHLPISKTLLPIRSNFSLFHFFLFLIGWTCCLSQFPRARREALCMIERRPVSHFLRSNSKKRNLPVIVRWNSRFHITSKAAPAAIEKPQVEILSWQVSALAVFLRKGDSVSI